MAMHLARWVSIALSPSRLTFRVHRYRPGRQKRRQDRWRPMAILSIYVPEFWHVSWRAKMGNPARSSKSYIQTLNRSRTCYVGPRVLAVPSGECRFGARPARARRAESQPICWSPGGPAEAAAFKTLQNINRPQCGLWRQRLRGIARAAGQGRLRSYQEGWMSLSRPDQSSGGSGKTRVTWPILRPGRISSLP